MSQKIKNNNIELHADLESQVKALQAQITSLQALLTALHGQVQAITAATTTNTTTSTTTATTNNTAAVPMESEPAATSPRERAQKRHRSSESQDTTSEDLQDFEETEPQIDTTKTQPTHPNQGLDPGEQDSTL